MNTYAAHLNPRNTPQTEPIPGKPMVANSAGGFAFAVDDWSRLQRFLITGSSGGTFYAGERKLILENADCVNRCLDADPIRALEAIAQVSEQGRAPKNDPAVFALAIAASRKQTTQKYDWKPYLPRVCRIPTHLFDFVAACRQMGRGWGRSMRTAISNCYKQYSDRQFAYHAVKYQQRGGLSHANLFDLSHFKAEAPRLVIGHNKAGKPLYHYGDTQNAKAIICRWAKRGWPGVGEQPHDNPDLLPIWAFERAKRATSEAEIVRLIRNYRLVRECVPTQWLNSPAVWEALLVDMPLTALVKNLGKMTSIGLLAPLSEATREVCRRLTDPAGLKKARVHPLNLLVALKTYASGKGDKGALTWKTNQQVVDALDAGFYAAFGAVEPTSKRWLIGLDVSASMSAAIAGLPLSCCEAATALGMLTAKTEPYTFVGAFNHGFTEIPFGKCQRLDEALRYTRSVNFGGTDCALPMTYALSRRIPVDCFMVVTDCETHSGRIHPSIALQEYRNKMGIGAKLIVLAMTATKFTIADPADAGMMDIAGLDLSVPSIISEFVRD